MDADRSAASGGRVILPLPGSFGGRLLLSLLLLPGVPAAAQDIDVTVRVTITEVEALEDFEGGGSADWYSYVTIDGHEQGNEDTPETDNVEDMDHVFVNWQFDQAVDLAKGSASVMIEIRDEDGFFRLGDDLADIDPDTDARFVDFDVELATCAVSGEVTGTCGQVFASAGNDPADDGTSGRAEVHFKVEVLGLPAEVPEMLVRCAHRPIWPSPGDTVEVTVEALNGELDPRLADQVQVWLGGNLLESRSGRTRHVATFQTTAGSFVYGCRVVDTPVFPEDEPVVFTGWRRVQQGNPPSGRAVPVLYTGEPEESIDILFVPDEDSYPGGASDPAFLDGVESSVYDPELGYYSEKVLLEHQDRLSIWLARDPGDADPDTQDADNDGSTDDCRYPHTPPADFDTEYLFAEAAAILHTDMFRDCAQDRLFSTEPPSITGLRTVVHETGHRPFGLADEYCCDTFYFQPDPLPNLYETQAGCAADAPDVGKTGADCRTFTDDDGEDWFTSDPADDDDVMFADDDLMDDRGPARPLDRRRIEWLFGECEKDPPEC